MDPRSVSFVRSGHGEHEPSRQMGSATLVSCTVGEVNTAEKDTAGCKAGYGVLLAVHNMLTQASGALKLLAFAIVQRQPQ